MTAKVRKTFPALRCHMGDWAYYVTFMKFDDVVHWIKRTDQIHSSQELRDMIQRELTNRVNPIADYLIEQKERFFNAIVVGIYGGAPQWYPLEIGDSPVLGSAELDSDTRHAIGLLMLDGNEKLFAIDGQHRVEAIKIALQKDTGLGNEEQSMVFVAHRTDEQGQVRTRRLFSTLNRYAKPVSRGEIIALDEDDAFAITTRQLVEKSPLLKGRVHFGKTAPLQAKDKTHLTSIIALYEITQTVYVPDLTNATIGKKRQIKRLKIRRPSAELLDEIYRTQARYWKLLKMHVPAYQEFFDSDIEKQIPGKYRTEQGGHLMFRPAGQQAFAKTVRTMLERRNNMETVVAKLSSVPMQLNEKPWEYVLWNPSTKRINATVSKVLLENLFLYLVGEKPRDKNYDLLSRYRDILNDQNAQLPPPVNALL